MLSNLIGLIVLLALVVLCGWLAIRAWGTKRGALLKWAGVILSGLLTVILALVFVVATIGVAKTSLPASNPVSSVQVVASQEQIARGSKFATFCAGCHSTTGKPPLDGSKDDFISGPDAPPVGSLFAPNLTPAGELKNWSNGEIIRAIREGIHKSGRPLIIMPSGIFHNLSDADVQAIVAYLRSQPAAPNKPQNDTPSNGLNLVGALFVGAGLFDTSAQAPITQPVVAPPEGPTAEYGRYLVDVVGCRECHGTDLAGGKPGGFGPPAGPNLTVLVTQWTESDFVNTIRAGTDPTGHALNADEMPWKEISAFASDDDLKAIYAYLHGLTPITKSVK